MRILALASLAVFVSVAHADYVLDDGDFEDSIGLNAGGTFVWANQFTVQSGLEVITGAQFAFAPGSGLTAGSPFIINLWSDPNGDGNPNDSSVLATMNATIPAGFENMEFTTFSFASPVQLSVGQNFFLGARITHIAGALPAMIDETSSARKSWIGVGSNWSGSIGLVDNLIGPGNWAIRGTAQPVPEPATMAALGLGLAAIARRRKSRRG